ncbi:MAG: hypothetical protein IPO98_07120 [Saprospiraceae bacterium]|nr:hypothetical protein [Saprospiraceae bacterium]
MGSYTDSIKLTTLLSIEVYFYNNSIIILAGLFLFVIQQLTDSVWKKNIIHYLLAFSIIFPLVYIVIRDSNVYGGWRQVLFLYPPMAALSALGIYSIRESIVNKLPALKNFSGLFWSSHSCTLSGISLKIILMNIFILMKFLWRKECLQIMNLTTTTIPQKSNYLRLKVYFKIPPG